MSVVSQMLEDAGHSADASNELYVANIRNKPILLSPPVATQTELLVRRRRRQENRKRRRVGLTSKEKRALHIYDLPRKTVQFGYFDWHFIF